MIIAPFMERFGSLVSDLWWYKIPDNRYTGKKPYDVFGFYSFHEKKKALAFEFKIHTSIEVWPCAKVIEYQEASLKRAADFDADARVVLGIRHLLSFDQQREFGYPTRRVFLDVAWPIKDFLVYKNKHSTLNIRMLLKHGVRGQISGRDLL